MGDFLRFCALASVFVLGELWVRPLWSSVFFLSVPGVPYWLGPLWVGLPNFVWYLVFALAFSLALRGLLAPLTAFLFLSALLMWQVQYPAGMWFATDFWSVAMSFAPIVALPVGIVLGAIIGKWLRQSGRSQQAQTRAS